MRLKRSLRLRQGGYAIFKVAVVGSGYIAQNHFAALRTFADVQVVAVVARNAEKGEQIARENGAHFYQSLKEAKEATGMNVVVITTPTHLHEQFVIEAAQLGCHVLCEKPITFTVESFDRMVAACKDSGVHFMVAQVARWWPEFITMKDYIDSGKLGDIHMIYEKRLCQHPTWADWHRDPARSGGGLYDLNVHDIDYLCSIFGKPATVYANGWKSPTGCWNHVCTSLTWANGAKAVVETSLEMTGNWPFSIEFRASGDRGTLCYAMSAGFNLNDGEKDNNLRWYPVGGEVEQLEAEQNDMFVGEISEFFASIRENREASVTNAQVREVLQVLEATVRSLENNIVVKL